MSKEKSTEFADIVNEIGWSFAECARRVGRPRNTVLRWADGTAAAPPEVLAWLRRVAHFHALVKPSALIPRETSSADLLAQIGWTPGILADQLETPVGTVRHWIARESTPEAVYRWLLDLAFFHKKVPLDTPPLSEADAKRLSLIETLAMISRDGFRAMINARKAGRLS